MNVRVDKATITLGNILSIATTVLAFGGVVAGIATSIADIRENMNVKDRELETRVIRLENDMNGVKSDHDLVIEIRADLKAIRASIDKMDGGKRASLQ